MCVVHVLCVLYFWCVVLRFKSVWYILVCFRYVYGMPVCVCMLYVWYESVYYMCGVYEIYVWYIK